MNSVYRKDEILLPKKYNKNFKNYNYIFLFYNYKSFAF